MGQRQLGLPAVSPTGNKGLKFPPEAPTPEEVQALRRAANPSSWTGHRNATFIAFLYRTGLRCKEALHVRPMDLDLDREPSVFVREGKGRKSRHVPFDAELATVLVVWLNRRGEATRSPRKPLFCTHAAGKMCDAYVREFLPRLRARAQIERRIHAHGLRHAYAHGLREDGFDVVQIRDLLGHESIAVTDAYLKRIGCGPATRQQVENRPAWNG